MKNKTASLLPQSFLLAETPKLQKTEYKKIPAFTTGGFTNF
jgi:hypothetical protein